MVRHLAVAGPRHRQEHFRPGAVHAAQLPHSLPRRALFRSEEPELLRLQRFPDPGAHALQPAPGELRSHQHAVVLDHLSEQPECHLTDLRPAQPGFEQRGSILLAGRPSDLVMHSLRMVLTLAMLAAAHLAAQSLADKSRLLQKNLTERHLLDGLYVSIVPAVEPGVELRHTVDEPGNVIHAGVW